jgi:hypothetical protein
MLKLCRVASKLVSMQFCSKLSRNMFQIRSFSGINNKKLKKSLVDALRVEIVREEEDYEVDQEYLDYKEVVSRSFTLNERPNVKAVILTRTFNKEEAITVKFNLDDITDANGDETYPGQQQEDDGNDEIPEGVEIGGFGIEFEVKITREGKGSLVLFCTASMQLTVDNATYYPEGFTVGDERIFAGRDLFATPEIQKAFRRYLKKRKIDENFRLFMMSHFNVKESSESLGWMKNVLKFSLKKSDDRDHKSEAIPETQKE